MRWRHLFQSALWLAHCLAILTIGLGCSAVGESTRDVEQEPVADLSLRFSQTMRAGAVPTYFIVGEDGSERLDRSRIEAYIATKFSSDKRGFIRFRIEKATHGPRTGDEVAVIAHDLERWGRAMGFAHGEICLDVGYLELKNPRAVLRDW